MHFFINVKAKNRYFINYFYTPRYNYVFPEITHRNIQCGIGFILCTHDLILPSAQSVTVLLPELL